MVRTRKFDRKTYTWAADTWSKADAIQMADYLKNTYHKLVRVTAVKRKRAARHGSKRGYQEGTHYTIWKRDRQ